MHEYRDLISIKQTELISLLVYACSSKFQLISRKLLLLSQKVKGCEIYFNSLTRPTKKTVDDSFKINKKLLSALKLFIRGAILFTAASTAKRKNKNIIKTQFQKYLAKLSKNMTRFGQRKEKTRQQKGNQFKMYW